MAKSEPGPELVRGTVVLAWRTGTLAEVAEFPFLGICAATGAGRAPLPAVASLDAVPVLAAATAPERWPSELGLLRFPLGCRVERLDTIPTGSQKSGRSPP